MTSFSTIIFSLLLGLTSSTLLASEPLNFGTSYPDLASQRIVENASQDFKAVLSGKKPVHAKFDRGQPLPTDGGTQFYKAKGYALTIVKRLVSVAGVNGYMYGSIIRFKTPIVIGNSDRISQVGFYSADALKELFKTNAR